MENINISANAVLPLFFFMLIGYISRHTHIIDEKALTGMNAIMFRCFLPMLLFYNIYGQSITIDPLLFWFVIITVTINFVALSLIVPKIVKEPARRGAIIQGIMRSNSAIYGLPMATSLLGSEHVATVSMIIASVVIPFNVFSIITLEINRLNKPNVLQILKQIITNPLIISILLAICCNALRITLPSILISVIKDMGGITTPFAFFILGAFFTFSAAAKNRLALGIVCLIKLIAAPAIFLTIAILMGMRDLALVCVLVVFAPPTAVSSFPMASVMNSDAELAGEIVVFTSAFSIITVFLFILILKSFGFI